MSEPRKIGIMVDSKAIEANMTSMTDVIRNANYKTLEKQKVQPNEDGEYLDAEGENLLMEEGVVKALLRDALDSYLVAALPGKNKGDPKEFQYYLLDSFPNVAEHVQSDDRINSYLGSLFANTCGLMASTLTPALQDIAAHGQTLEHIETFSIGRSNNYYVLIGEESDQPLDDNPDHAVIRMTKEERLEHTREQLKLELGPEGYAKHCERMNNERFTDYVGIIGSIPPEEALLLGERHLKASMRKPGAFGRYYFTGDDDKPTQEWQSKQIEPLPLHPHVSRPPDFGYKLTPQLAADLGLLDERTELQPK